MPNKLKILFATDYSHGSKLALKTLKLLHQQFITNVHLLCVLESFWGNWFTSGRLHKEVSRRVQVWLHKIKPYSSKREAHVEVGNAGEWILETAKKESVDLILLGGKTPSTSERYKTGHTVESVIRCAKVPVWVAKNAKIKKIVCGIDGSRHSKKSLSFAIGLAKRYRANLCILHALPDFLPPFGMNTKQIKEEEAKLKAKNVDKITKLVDKFDLKNLKYDVVFSWGAPANVLLDYAEDFEMDLIVIGARGHRKLYHVFIGTTAEKIIHYAPCSLLVIR